MLPRPSRDAMAGRTPTSQLESKQADDNHSPSEVPRAHDMSVWLRTPASMKLPSTPPSGLMVSLSGSMLPLVSASQPTPRQGSQIWHHEPPAVALSQAAQSAARDSSGSAAAHASVGHAELGIVQPWEGSPVLLPCAHAAAGLASPPQPHRSQGLPVAEALQFLHQGGPMAATTGSSGSTSRLSPVEQLFQHPRKVHASDTVKGSVKARRSKNRHPPTPAAIRGAAASEGPPTMRGCHPAEWQRMEVASRVQLPAAKAGIISGPAAGAQAATVGAVLQQLLWQSKAAIKRHGTGLMAASQGTPAPGQAGFVFAVPPQQLELDPDLQQGQAAPPAAAEAGRTPTTSVAADEASAVAAAPDMAALEKACLKDLRGFTAERVPVPASKVKVSGCSVHAKPAELPLQSRRSGHEDLVKPSFGPVEAPACEANFKSPACQTDSGVGGTHERATAAPACKTMDNSKQLGGSQHGHWQTIEGRAAQHEPCGTGGNEAAAARLELNIWVRRQQEVAKATGIAPVWSSWNSAKGPVPFKATFGSALLGSPTLGFLRSQDEMGSEQQGRPASAVSAPEGGPLAPPKSGPATVGGGAGECPDGKGFSMRSQRYKGVYRMPTGRWRAQFTHMNRVIQLGMFDIDTEAAHAWDKAAIQYRGASTHTNLPVERATAEAWAAEPFPAIDGACTNLTKGNKPPTAEASRATGIRTGVSSAPRQPERGEVRVQGPSPAADSRPAQQPAAAPEQPPAPQQQRKRRRSERDQPGFQFGFATDDAASRPQEHIRLPKRRRTAPQQAKDM